MAGEEGWRVVVVEDDPDVRSLLMRGLREEGFAVVAEERAAGLVRRIESGERPDVLVVDIGLPDADGRDLVQAIRAAGVDAPVLFLTARDALPDRLSGFAAGGDDYLTKPFAFAELVARIGALLRRSAAREEPALPSGLRLDPGRHAVACGNTSVAVTPTEFRILARLAASPGEAVRRRELARAAWPHGAIVHDNTLDVYITRLRRKLEELPEAPVIANVRGVGFSLR